MVQDEIPFLRPRGEAHPISRDALELEIRLLREMLEPTIKRKSGGDDGNGGKYRRGWESFALRILLPLLTAAVLGLIGLVLSHESSLSVVEDTRFTAEDGGRLRADMVREIQEHNRTEGHATMRERVNGHERRIRDLESR